MRRLQVEGLGAVDERVPLLPSVRHHALHVLRLPHGAPVRAFDGQGREAQGRLEVEEGAAWIRVLQAPVACRPEHPLHLLLAVLKGPAMDLAVRMATEAGATHVHPYLAGRSVARGDRGDRWRRITESAAQQCGRADIPTVHPVGSLADALDALGPVDLRVALPGAGDLPPATGQAALLIGPEGGLTQEEITLALERGGRPMGLGRWTLRADTAVAVGLGRTAPASM